MLRSQINIRSRFDNIYDQDQLLNQLDYIKLNGSVDRADLGFIFSPNEYGEASANVPVWYNELAEDFYRYTFLFIGTKLNEPLFYHQIARYKSISNSIETRSYVLTPSATEIEKGQLLSLNIEHIQGSLLEFTVWLQKEFPTPLRPMDISFNKNPALREMLSQKSQNEKEKYASLFNDIVLVNRLFLKSHSQTHSVIRTKVRSFYRGFKPDWCDILDDVPARISFTNSLIEKIDNCLNSGNNLVVVYGPAGSGKTTLLMQAALHIADNKNIPCYFLERPTSDFKRVIEELEKITESRYCLFYDRLDSHAIELKEIIDTGLLKKGIFIGSESQRKWESVVKDYLGGVTSTMLKISEITKEDAQKILDKIEVFGPWTRLSKMTKTERLDELFSKSKRQLLIGLLETTYGIGFEKIIEKEYLDLKNDTDKKFLILVGLATIHKYYIKQEYVSRALTSLRVDNNITQYANRLSGVIHFQSGRLLARHPIYIRHLFNEVIDSREIFPILCSLLKSYTVYEAPISKKIGRNELQLYKALINHKFLKDIFRSSKDLVVQTYMNFEKYFEKDGLFWLQYGLALRDFGEQADALEKIKFANFAFPNSPHTEHALAQQELILACECSYKAQAFSLLESAKERLESLDKILKSHDTYPIVSLSEGHTKVIRRFEGDAKAQEVAKVYANRISSYPGFDHDTRLKKAWSKLTKYVAAGQWFLGEDSSEEFTID